MILLVSWEVPKRSFVLSNVSKPIEPYTFQKPDSISEGESFWSSAYDAQYTCQMRACW